MSYPPLLLLLRGLLHSQVRPVTVFARHGTLRHGMTGPKASDISGYIAYWHPCVSSVCVLLVKRPKRIVAG